MAEDSEILAALETLVHAFPGQTLSQETARLYVRHLSDLSPKLLIKVVKNLIASSKWFPRVAEMRAEAVRIAGIWEISTWDPASRDLLSNRYDDLEKAFYHDGHLDPDEWLELADLLEQADRPHMAQAARDRLEACQSLLCPACGLYFCRCPKKTGF